MRSAGGLGIVCVGGC